MPETKPTQISICMGSSCFSRGNNRNIKVVQNFLTNTMQTVPADLAGHLCEGLCKNGPNLTIDGKVYHELDPVAVLGLLNHHLSKPKEEAP